MWRTRNTYQHGWIETRPSKKDGLEFVYRWRERKPDGGYTKRSEVIGPVSMLKPKPMPGGRSSTASLMRTRTVFKDTRSRSECS
jgi:hypothetical protein